MDKVLSRILFMTACAMTDTKQIFSNVAGPSPVYPKKRPDQSASPCTRGILSPLIQYTYTVRKLRIMCLYIRSLMRGVCTRKYIYVIR